MMVVQCTCFSFLHGAFGVCFHLMFLFPQVMRPTLASIENLLHFLKSFPKIGATLHKPQINPSLIPDFKV